MRKPGLRLFTGTRSLPGDTICLFSKIIGKVVHCHKIRGLFNIRRGPTRTVLVVSARHFTPQADVIYLPSGGHLFSLPMITSRLEALSDTFAFSACPSCRLDAFFMGGPPSPDAFRDVSVFGFFFLRFLFF